MVGPNRKMMGPWPHLAPPWRRHCTVVIIKYLVYFGLFSSDNMEVRMENTAGNMHAVFESWTIGKEVVD